MLKLMHTALGGQCQRHEQRGEHERWVEPPLLLGGLEGLPLENFETFVPFGGIWWYLNGCHAIKSFDDFYIIILWKTGIEIDQASKYLNS